MPGCPCGGIDAAGLGDLILDEPGGELAISVVDELGQSIQGAVVVVGVRGELAAGLRRTDELPSSAPPQTARTDAAGSAGAFGLAVGPHSVLVCAPGFAPFHDWVQIGTGGARQFVVRLVPGARLCGRLVDGDGQPVPGVQLACRTENAFVCVDGTTGPDGCFDFASLPIGTIGLLGWIRSVNVVDRVVGVEAGETRIDLTVQPPGQRRGRLLTGAGVPLSGWAVALPVRSSRSVEGGHHFGRSDATGGVDLVVPTGAAWDDLMVQSPASPYWTRVGACRQDLADGSFVVRVPSEKLPQASFTCRFTASDGRPLGHAAIHGRDQFGREALLGIADEDGRFGFGPVPSETFQLFVASPSPELPALDLVTLPIAAGTIRHFDLTVPPTGSIGYALRFADGSRPRAPLVTLSRPGATTGCAQLRASRGQQVLAPGSYWLTAVGEDFVAIEPVAVEVRAGESRELEIEVVRACSRQFSLLGLPPEFRGGSLRGCFYDDATDAPLWRFRTAVDQAFPLPLVGCLPPGRIRLEAETDSGQKLVARLWLEGLDPVSTPRLLDFVPVR